MDNEIRVENTTSKGKTIGMIGLGAALVGTLAFGAKRLITKRIRPEEVEIVEDEQESEEITEE